MGGSDQTDIAITNITFTANCGDGRTWTQNNTQCNMNQFACNDSSSCISSNMICDCWNDCNDGSDEVGCNNCTEIRECNGLYFDCGDAKRHCIPRYLLCDNVKDCQSGADEDFKTCGKFDV